MFESRHEALIPRRHFYRRMLKFLIAALLIDAMMVTLGAVGYRVIGGLPWIDALLNSALVITGNGPIGSIQSTAGKLFTVADALLGGITFVVVAAVLLAPVIHRMLHALNVDPSQPEAVPGEGA